MIVTTVLEEGTKTWHTIVRVGHFFSAYQKELKKMASINTTKTKALKAHDTILEEIMKNKALYIETMVRTAKCI